MSGVHTHFWPELLREGPSSKRELKGKGSIHAPATDVLDEDPTHIVKFPSLRRIVLHHLSRDPQITNRNYDCLFVNDWCKTLEWRSSQGLGRVELDIVECESVTKEHADILGEYADVTWTPWDVTTAPRKVWAETRRERPVCSLRSERGR